MSSTYIQQLLLLLSLALLNTQPIHPLRSGAPTDHCKEDEMQALLDFKAGFDDPSNRLSSWGGKNCCEWSGVTCDNNTGNIISLDLQSPGPSNGLHITIPGIRKIRSLLALKHLSYLDLSRNNFHTSYIPEFIGSLEKLEYLDLSGARFSGSVPHQLGNLSSLKYLDLSNEDLHIDDCRWLSQLTSLEYLKMDLVKFERDSNWLLALNMLPSLVELHLYWCRLERTPPPQHVNFTSLSILDLSFNNISSTIPSWLFNIHSLKFLNLGWNNFHGTIPEAIGNNTNLETLDLSGNKNLEVGGSKAFRNLCKLKSLSMSIINIYQKLANIGEIFSRCTKNNLEYLWIEDSGLTGNLPDWLWEFKNLKQLALGMNQLEGAVPASLRKLSNLESLYLRQNFLEGFLTEEHFVGLGRLKKLDIAYNSLILKVSSSWIPPFQLDMIRMTSSPLGPQFPSWLHTQKNLSSIELSHAKLSDVVPEWFWNLSSQLQHLDLSHNELRGKLPFWINFQNTENLYIDLSSNSFEGSMPYFPSNVGYLDLSNNSLSGYIPHKIGEVMASLKYLSLSMNNISDIIPSSLCKIKELTVLDLSENHLSGQLPNCWNCASKLLILDVKSNHLIGGVPDSICSSGNLKSLHLGNNNFSGEFPLSLSQCREIVTLDLGENKFTGSIPIWVGGKLNNLKILILRSNLLNGNIPPLLSELKDLQVLDLSNNNLSGNIPPTFGNFSAMKLVQNRLGSILLNDGSNYVENILIVFKGREIRYDILLSLVSVLDLSNNYLSGNIPRQLADLYGLKSLNLSGNHLSGEITPNIGGLGQLEALDLSKNIISGAIPHSLSNLNFLSHLNLSYNNLSGRIPTGNQLQTFTDASIYIGNVGLCGIPLSTKCEDEKKEPQLPTGGNGDGDETVSYQNSIGYGFFFGLSAFFGLLALKRTWRTACFELVDRMYDMIPVAECKEGRLKN